MALQKLKILRWVAAVILPTAITLGMLVIFNYIYPYRIYWLPLFNLHFLIHGVDLIFVYSSYVLLCCSLAPSPRKYGILITFTGGALVMYAGLRSLWIHQQWPKGPKMIIVSTLIFIIIGLAIGVILSFKILKNKGWSVNKEVVHENQRNALDLPTS